MITQWHSSYKYLQKNQILVSFHEIEAGEQKAGTPNQNRKYAI